MKNVTYTMQGDYRLPDLLPPQEPEIRLGKYALLRRRYLKEHRRVTYTNLLTSGKLNEHLLEIEQTVKERLTEIIPKMMASEGVTEEMKASDQMKWVNMMNNIRASAEEIVLKELVYN
ncbi:MAG: TnpV protein [Clostridia bacterium]|nr:TnpV protein [Clostridia bacterium]